MKRWNLLETIAFAAFLAWGAVGLFFTVRHISPEAIAHGPVPPELLPFVEFCLQYGDPILILLAFANTHLHAARQWTPVLARKWAAQILVCSLGIETIGTTTGLPFGNYHYTDQFGPLLGVVPFTIPFAWHVVVTNALFTVRSVAPYCAPFAEALLAGLLCTLYDFVLEPFATQVRHYWIWTAGDVPMLNYVAWFVLSAVLIGAFVPTLSSRYRLDLRPQIILLLTVLIFLAGRWYA